MLSEIVDTVVGRIAKRYRTNLEVSDLRQEAWVAVLEAEREGVIDPKVMGRRAFNHLLNLVKRESRRREFPSEFVTL